MALTAIAVAFSSVGGGSLAAAASTPVPPVVSQAVLPPAAISATVVNGQVLRAGDLIQLTTTRASMDDITLSAGRLILAHFNAPLAPVLTWDAPTDLPPQTLLTLVAHGYSVDGHPLALTRTFTSAAGALTAVAHVSPTDNQTVGVGYPVIVTLNAPVPLSSRAAIEKALTVTSNRATGPASWSWMGPKQLHYRPATFWPAHARITVHIALRGVHLGLGVWGGGSQNVSFRTGRSMVMSIVNATHRMTVTVDGKVVRTMPVSLGKPGDETRSGIKVVMERYRLYHMQSASLGILTGPEFYDVMAPFAIRITNSGEFLHGAPWNGSIGYANRSHGCTNLHISDAQWLFDNTLVGDPVITSGTGRAMESTNGLGGDWDIPYSTWTSHSALH